MVVSAQKESQMLSQDHMNTSRLCVSITGEQSEQGGLSMRIFIRKRNELYKVYIGQLFSPSIYLKSPPW